MSKEILKERPLVSIAIPCYNKEPYVHRCINSVLSQSYKNIEVFFIDDCSTDNSVKIAETFNDKRLKIIKHTINSGTPAKALNYSLDNSVGDYWMYISGDDYLDLDSVLTLLVNIEDNDYIYGDLCLVNANNRFLKRWEYRDLTNDQIIRLIYESGGRGVVPLTGLWRTELIQCVGWSDIDHSDDTMTSIKACQFNWKRRHIDYDFYFYRHHEGQITNNLERREKALKKICDYIEENYEYAIS